jgi:pimeloyl-ACP methyl ester carboxylesterase
MDKPTPFTLQVDQNRSLDGLVHSGSRPGPRPTIVVCHGFKGFMGWGFFPALAELLSERGFTVVGFNFTGNGMQPGDELVTNHEAFQTATFSQDLEDLLALLSALGDSVAEGLVDLDRVGLLGHSRGGGAAILAAADAYWIDKLGALVTWSAVSTFDRLDDAAKLAWRQKGTTPMINARTGQALLLDRIVLDDLEKHRDELDILAAAGRRLAPWLLIHGEADETVPVAEARTLAEHAAGKGVLLEIPAASHTFGATHPFAGPTPQLIEAFNATQSWFRQHLMES